MKTPLASRIALTLLVLSCAFLVPSLSHAQGDIGKPSKPQGDIQKPPLVRPAIIIRTPPKTVYLTPKTGSLTITAESGAVILVESLSRRDAPLQATVKEGERSVIFNELLPGKYRVKGQLDGYEDDAKEKVVQRNVSDKVDLFLKAKTYNVVFDLNAPSGRVMYAKGNEPPRAVDFRERRALLTALRPGTYLVTFEPDDVAYSGMSTNIEVTDNINRTITLEKRLSTKEFSWYGANDWSLPVGWRAASGKLTISGKGAALPSDDSFRHYKDFQLSATVKMLNGVAASFVVRARDPRNYYLIQLTGPDADERYVVRGFVIQDGVERRLPKTCNIVQASGTIKEGRFFQTSLSMKGSSINVSFIDETGENLPLCMNLTDPAETFPIGAVGIAVRDKEKNEIETFIVSPVAVSNRL